MTMSSHRGIGLFGGGSQLSFLRVESLDFNSDLIGQSFQKRLSPFNHPAYCQIPCLPIARCHGDQRH